MRLPVGQLGTQANPISLGDAKPYHLPDWHSLSHPQRLTVLRNIATGRGRDPRMATLAVQIVRKSGAKPRQYKDQAAAILKWVQDNVYYVNEPGERLQDPLYTLKAGYGDCDDLSLLLCSLYESLNLPWKFVLSGRSKDGQKLRYIEGNPVPDGVTWVHVYAMVGTPPFTPTIWYFCEPTVRGVPLGWDVISGDRSYLPEMDKPYKGPPKFAIPLKANRNYRPAPLPAQHQRSPAYEMGYGQTGPMVGGSISASMAMEDGHDNKWLDWEKIVPAIVTGVAVSVSTSILLDWINGRGMWEGSGHVFFRAVKATAPAQQSILAGGGER